MNRVIQYHWLPAKWFDKGRFSHGKTQQVQSVILHSTDGHLAGDLQVLQNGRRDDKGRLVKVSVHWYVTRSGEVYHFVQNSDTANHVGHATKVMYSNAAAIGIEQEHIDGAQDWPQTQILRVAQLVAALRQTYGDLPVKSHAEVRLPKGDKVDPLFYPWEYLSQEVSATMHDVWTFRKI